MRTDLYQDLYKKEDNYWWFCGRRMFVDTLLKFLRKASPYEGEAFMGMKILDAGCGTGRQMEELKKYGEVFGFDVSPEALNFCQKRGLQNIVKANLNQPLPYPNESFDLITALDVLEHIENDQFALSELKRVLKIGGHLIITVPAHPFLWSYWDKSIHHQRRYNKKELQEKLRRVDFRIERISFTNFFILLPTVMMRIIRGFVFRNRVEQSTSDFIQLPRFLNKMLIGIYWFENLIFKRVNLPMGVSLVALVKKP